MASGARHPLYWRQLNSDWQARRFERWVPLNVDAPMLHVNRYEAEACAAWMGRRLPTAACGGTAGISTGHGLGLAARPLCAVSGVFARSLSGVFLALVSYACGTAELRGGGPVTDPALKRPGFRNFYLPHRRDPFAGFRTVGPG